MRPDDLALDNCLKCSLCNTVCPVLAADPRYPGPKRLGPELERLRRERISTDTDWVEYCLGCHRCDLVCPHQVNVSEMIARAKATHRKPLIRGLRDWWFARPGLLGKLATMLPALSNFALAMKPARSLMSKLMRITPQRTFPKYTRPDLRSPAIVKAARQRVVFFPGCFIRYNRPGSLPDSDQSPRAKRILRGSCIIGVLWSSGAGQRRCGCGALSSTRQRQGHGRSG